MCRKYFGGMVWNQLEDTFQRMLQFVILKYHLDFVPPFAPLVPVSLSFSSRTINHVALQHYAGSNLQSYASYASMRRYYYI